MIGEIMEFEKIIFGAVVGAGVSILGFYEASQSKKEKFEWKKAITTIVFGTVVGTALAFGIDFDSIKLYAEIAGVAISLQYFSKGTYAGLMSQIEKYIKK